ncbi:anthrax toxin-like adenylyl cyclase domain-containing protein [uncultured Microscilla sp.]|uniref:anthrax toxin-like adenylyl cyclase domain-containing protein n=1 Tax=uncultured Microscilla sp. TaxID=432653 RepID=UPI0026333115|nr:anthrax toxin-like adenylyl cyclase domain-containing protein [uncultured Microscilla sp.]
MQIGDNALKAVGMPECHGRQFLDAAEQQKTIIMSRAPGKYATKLIEEGYASKGFHNKAKSCNWGPMAGFVNTHPLFSKAGLTVDGQNSQKKSIKKAFKAGAQSTQVVISEARRLELINDLRLLREIPEDSGLKLFREMNKLGDLTPTCYKFSPLMTHVKGDYVKEASGYRFYLKERFLRTSGEFTSWQSAFVNTSLPKLWEVYYTVPEKPAVFLPVKSFVDPNFKKVNMDDYMSDRVIHLYATTADFDLFSVWADRTLVQQQMTQYKLDGKPEKAEELELMSREMDMRPAATLTLFSYSATEVHEDAEVGNITPRLSLLKNILNEKFKKNCGYNMGNLVHHSDEAGRPKIDDVDYPFIAFLPDNNEVATAYKSRIITIDGNGDYETVKREFKGLIDKAVKANFRVGLNPGWAKDLGEDKYLQYIIASNPKNNPFRKHYKEPTVVG